MFSFIGSFMCVIHAWSRARCSSDTSHSAQEPADFMANQRVWWLCWASGGTNEVKGETSKERLFSVGSDASCVSNPTKSWKRWLSRRRCPEEQVWQEYLKMNTNAIIRGFIHQWCRRRGLIFAIYLPIQHGFKWILTSLHIIFYMTSSFIIHNLIISSVSQRRSRNNSSEPFRSIVVNTWVARRTHNCQLFLLLSN